MSAVELVVLDMAGTAIEQGDEITLAFESALKKNDVPATREEILDWMGASKREVICCFVERHRGRDASNAHTVEKTHSDFRQTLIDPTRAGERAL